MHEEGPNRSSQTEKGLWSLLFWILTNREGPLVTFVLFLPATIMIVDIDVQCRKQNIQRSEMFFFFFFQGSIILEEEKS